MFHAEYYYRSINCKTNFRIWLKPDLSDERNETDASYQHSVKSERPVGVVFQDIAIGAEV